MYLKGEIERFLKITGMPPTRFGREAARDPRLVHDLRRGREIGARLAGRILSYMERGR